ncbi:uncharacterized protein ATC70_008427 [Mucor velutinosus]|uniref:Reverse transcriptase domain-containing protein n=1 Tax=Mucor velutinosus TaxID=708070 RepID=A0AAN7HPZ5_9FUNG|nr:hypothetical protein ATC70_008427 [Mucor velutinosus]
MTYSAITSSNVPTQNMMGHFYQHSVAGPHGRPSIMSTAHQRYFNNYTRPPLILCAPNGLIMPSSIPPFNSPPLNRLKRFQRKRNQLFKRYQNQPTILRERLPVIEKLISDLQQEISIQQTIRAGKMWREQGETSAGYLKRTVATRQIQRTIISELCNTIPASAQIPVNSQPTLETPFTIDEIMTGAQRSPNHSSPGTDGLPYEILAVLLCHQQTAQLAHAVFKEALTLGVFPDSWLTTCMCLLPKKGDLTNLRNFRPISLINCDAKIFTRLLNQRLMPHMQQLISPQQLGFMPNRFIGEHGFTLLLHTSMHLRQHSLSPQATFYNVAA